MKHRPDDSANHRTHRDAGRAVQLEIVVYGPGIGVLKGDSAVGKRVADALKCGVKVTACESTMKAQHFAHSDMLPGIACVPAGVVELMQKQRDLRGPACARLVDRRHSSPPGCP